jgi:hypothetical protein
MIGLETFFLGLKKYILDYLGQKGKDRASKEDDSELDEQAKDSLAARRLMLPDKIKALREADSLHRKLFRVLNNQTELVDILSQCETWKDNGVPLLPPEAREAFERSCHRAGFRVHLIGVGRRSEEDSNNLKQSWDEMETNGKTIRASLDKMIHPSVSKKVRVWWKPSTW